MCSLDSSIMRKAWNPQSLAFGRGKCSSTQSFKQATKKLIIRVLLEELDFSVQSRKTACLLKHLKETLYIQVNDSNVVDFQ